ncbi:hypothetical protein GOP47_0011506 [Adiantum capillus-veneris]|uniref:Enoyl reductase (ER) domain-containing protein n=1 Tax=Adiantum capillus-veneris TaxID=13818 RepID=A0A9D4ZFH0_ADICA|nr:hypothetical protein GOP47_0011506 [Adiantum capillus-veneris]
MAPPALPIKCKAAVAWGANQALVIEEIEVDAPHAGEVRIRIAATSLCHTDLTFLGVEQLQFPRILGHEAAGIVESVGEGVDDLKVGDHVLPVYQGECGKCAPCKSQINNLCEKYWPFLKTTMMLHPQDQKSRFSITREGRTQLILPFLTSTFSEYTVVKANCCAKISKEAPLDKACLMSCGVSTGLGAVWNIANVQKGSTVAVFGLGTIGLAAVDGARIAGASRIIGVDINPSKFELAKKCGVTECVNPKECDKPIQQVLQGLTNGGVDYAFECAGKMELVVAALESTQEGHGKTVVVGLDTPGSKLILDPTSLLCGRSIMGCVFGGFKGKTHVPGLVDMITKKEVVAENYISCVLPFEDINKALDLLKNGKSLRCVLTMS